MRGIIIVCAVTVALVVGGCNQEAQLPRDPAQQKLATKDDKGGASTKTPLKPDAEDSKDPKVQVPVGDGPAEAWVHLPFTITKVYKSQDFSKSTPFHADGGKWTFLDCRTTEGSQVAFTVGVYPRGEGKGPFAWGKAVLAVADRRAGDRFIRLFAKAFHAKSPRARSSTMPLEPLVMSTAILGEDLKRSPSGGFAGTGEGWTATKWFPQQYGLAASEGNCFWAPRRTLRWVIRPCRPMVASWQSNDGKSGLTSAGATPP